MSSDISKRNISEFFHCCHTNVHCKKSIEPKNSICFYGIQFNSIRFQFNSIQIQFILATSHWNFSQGQRLIKIQSKTGFLIPFKTKLVGIFLCKRASEHRRREKLMTPRITIPAINALVTEFSWKGCSLGEPENNKTYTVEDFKCSFTFPYTMCLFGARSVCTQGLFLILCSLMIRGTYVMPGIRSWLIEFKANSWTTVLSLLSPSPSPYSPKYMPLYLLDYRMILDYAKIQYLKNSKL